MVVVQCGGKKFQITNPKSQKNPKLQIPNYKGARLRRVGRVGSLCYDGARLRLVRRRDGAAPRTRGLAVCFGIWNLGFGVVLGFGILGFGICERSERLVSRGVEFFGGFGGGVDFLLADVFLPDREFGEEVFDELGVGFGFVEHFAGVVG
jgi:hypothetical protein